MSKSLAEEILKQKQEEQQSKKDDQDQQKSSGGGDEEKEKEKNFWKYWKIYAVVFTLFAGSCVNLAYLYCKYRFSLYPKYWKI